MTTALLEGQDWSAHPLGPPAQWPPVLAALVASMQRCQGPMFICWGPQAHLLYNDRYADVLRDKHPAAMGRPFREVWPEVGPELDVMLRQVYAGHGQHGIDTPFHARRDGRDETAWFSFVWNPVLAADGSVDGFFSTAFETTTAVRADQARAAEAERLLQMFEQAPNFIAVLSGPEHVYVHANPAYLDFVGRGEIIGRRVRDAIPEVTEQGWVGVLDEVYRTGAPYIGRATPLRLRRSGRPGLDEAFVDFVFQPMRDESGAINGILVVGHDVTDHQRTLRRLRDREQALLEAARTLSLQRRQVEALLESTPLGIAFVDREGRLLLASAENRQLWGPYPSPASVADYADFKGWWADDGPRHGQPLQPEDWPLARALRGEDVRSQVIEIETFDDPPRRRTMLLHAKPVRDDDGHIVNAVVAQIDITAQVEVENALRQSEARFRTIAEAMPQMVWSTRPDGFHDYYNQQWYAFTGVPDGSTDGEAWNGMFHPEDQVRAWNRWQHSLGTGDPYEIEYRLRHHSGEYRWVLGRALAVRDERGHIVRWMGTCTDIHDQVRAQEMLREEDRRKDEFLAMLAHELRNPLSPITSSAALLPRVADDPVRVRHIGALIARQAAHMRGLVDDLLDVSRVTSGLVALVRQPVDLRSVLAEALEQTRPLMDAQAHRVSIDAGSGPLSVLGDRNRLVQVFANLLNNAGKYTPREGRIHVGARLEDGQVVVSVRDNGLGMTPALLSRMFDLFVQGERTPDRSQGGLGIGLALVRRIVELHGGSVSGHSEGPGHGSELLVVLPLAAHGAATATATTTAGGLPAVTGLRVLVVDDNPDAGESLGLLLRDLGHEVHVERRAVAALETATRLRPQVCLLDIGLPDLDGRTLARRLRLLPGLQAVTIAVVSGYGQPQDLQASQAQGLVHFVKPVETAELLAWLDRVAGG
ncbi:PAS domain-containing protein [Aquabacterium sp. J223]|uniref:PAS domain-containing protein n=1 Tax=Aquabacterium sp. J223 TaxID=2898431 RepID=UPI0021AD68CF|nr:PAS domain-containing protein [Aquabacterium sp. J223]UUX94716.1 PAS domain-containing protein [Aquabacterium sp. J223]